MSEKLAILDESSDSEVEFKINKAYANRYNVWRNKEELQKYKDLQKEDDDSESSSEYEEEVPEILDEEFFRSMNLLKSKDPKIYDENCEFFNNKEVKKSKNVKEKPMFMKDYERHLILERGGRFSDDEDEPSSLKVRTYNEEQEDIKKSFLAALDDDSDGDNDLFQVKTNTKKEEDEEVDYLMFLKGEKEEVPGDVKTSMSCLRSYWNDPELDGGEKFLKNYVLNKRYLEKDDMDIPTHEEITSGMLSDDAKSLEEQEKFEQKYNFRFEEPDEEYIKRYPRDIGDSLRKEDNRRKQKREEKAERRRREREQRKEELKRLKALKRKEIEEKFSKLREVSGQDEINLNESDMESDFDPDKHDLKMSEIFNNDYYNVEEDQKPEFPFDEELDSENWNTWAGEEIVTVEEEGEGDHEVNLAENYKVNVQQKSETNPKEHFEKEMIESTQPKKRVKKKSLFAEVISKPKPIFDPDGKSFDDYLDEYYKLDYEDIIGDLPVRYKYRKVIPNDFGLTVEEILAADDRELNRWCSVKKTCQFRNDDEELYDVQAYKKKSQNTLTKEKIFSSLYAPKELDDEVNNDAIEHRSKNAKYHCGGSNNYNSVGEDGTINVNDIAKSNSYDTLDQEYEPNTSMQNNQNNKKPRKRKSKSKLDNSCVNSEPSNRSLLESFDYIENEKDNISHQQTLAKRKKRKHMDVSDEGTNSVNLEPDSESSKLNKRKREIKKNKFLEIEVDNIPQKHNDANNIHNTTSTFNSVVVPDISSQEIVTKKKKKKRNDTDITNKSIDKAANSIDLEPDSESLKPNKMKRESNKNKFSEIEVDNVPQKHNDTSNIHNTTSTFNSVAVPDISSQEFVTKKKKKKKQKNKRDLPDQTAMSHNQRRQISTYKSKDKGNICGDRMSVFGINPKKCKNRILHCKK